MWSELALQFLGTVTNPVIVLLPALLLLFTRRKSLILAGTAAAGAAFGLMEAMGNGALEGALVVVTSALAGAVAAEVVLAIVLPLGLMALSCALWLRARLRPTRDDQAP
ncbi:hypothetical protein [Salinarimonas soli]|uniref:Uncharacterized protein n=1 Tax=Salinarimonas soli TaxID=1638099 RepID=A0A5B2VSK3_9HYPH|nr:hypothetical protein [Salinarimonas soli]KAA2241059.1 hypothetical protein F0L46_05325 [Salinarimonas soli]